jgi:SPP1 family predicted phage head-tail adaptor
MLVAGLLPHRVTLQASTETDDGHDGYTEDWDDVPPVRRSARVQPLQGRDLERARQIDPRISHELTLRYWRAYQADLDGGRVRVVYHPTDDSDDDRTLEIVGAPVDVDEAHIELMFSCTEAA